MRRRLLTTNVRPPAPAQPVQEPLAADTGRYRGLRFSGIRRLDARHLLHRPRPRSAAGAYRVAPAIVAIERELAAPEEASFLRQLFVLAGLPLPHYRIAPLVRRLPACLRAIQAGSLAEAERLVQDDPALLASAIDTLVIGVTSFFRDTPVFDCLRDEVLPALAGERPLRIWSAACSDGSELYSIAMLAAMSEVPIPIARLLGTDCRTSALEKAREGRYPAQQVEEIDPAIRARFFTPRADGTFELSPQVRRQAQWEFGDLTTAPAPIGRAGDWDLVLCRNMAIYVNEQTAVRLWMSLADALRPGGYLVVGKAERPRLAGLRRVGPSIYRKQ